MQYLEKPNSEISKIFREPSIDNKLKNGYNSVSKVIDNLNIYIYIFGHFPWFINLILHKMLHILIAIQDTNQYKEKNSKSCPKGPKSIYMFS